MPSKVVHFDVNITAAEDLHSGSGTGWLGLVDAQQSRDSKGLPVIWWSHFRGVLRDCAERVVNSPDGAGLKTALKTLFGLLGSEQGLACVRSLTLSNDLAANHFTIATSSARNIHDRRPLDNSLRTVEFVRSGTEFESSIRLSGESGDVDNAVKLLERALDELSALGKRRTRGDGAVLVERKIGGKHDLTFSPNEDDLQQEKVVNIDTSKCLRLALVLENLEPLLFTNTQHAGNILNGLPYIPAAAIRGALLTWLSERQCAKFGTQALSILSFGDGYPLPADVLETERRPAHVIPIPLSIKAPKNQSVSHAASGLPWWTSGDKSTQFVTGLFGNGEVDEASPLAEEESVKGAPRLHRVKDSSFVHFNSASQRWTRFTPQRRVILHNKVPRRDLTPSTTSASALFSEYSLSERQRFIAEIVVASADADANPAALDTRKEFVLKFLTELSPLKSLPDAHNSCPWLRLGRGGRPVVVIDWWIRQGKEAELPRRRAHAKQSELTVTLTSDLILRSQFGSYHIDIDTETLPELTGLADEDLKGVKLSSQSGHTDFVEIFGFNRATGAQRAPALGIRRGSVLRIEMTKGPAEKLEFLRTHLRNRIDSGHYLGERTDEGYGRFELDLEFDNRFRASQAGGSYSSNPSDSEFLQRAFDCVDAIRKLSHPPSSTQLNAIRSLVNCGSAADQIRRLLAISENRSNKDLLKCVKEILKSATLPLTIYSDKGDFTVKPFQSFFDAVVRLLVSSRQRKDT